MPTPAGGHMPPYQNRDNTNVRLGQPLSLPQRPPANRRPSKRSHKRTLSPAAYERIAAAAKFWRSLVGWISGIAGGGVVAIVLGFSPFPDTVPLVVVARRYPVEAVVVAIVLVLITVIARFIPDEPKDKKHPEHADPNQPKQKPIAPWVYSTVVSTISLALFLSLLEVVLIRPAWCSPTPLCPAPLLITNPKGVHDANLEVFFTAFQSQFFVIAGDPKQYSPSNPPQTIGAVRIDEGAAASIYRVALGIHSLQQGRFGLLIAQVALVVDGIPDLPNPLNVWDGGLPRTYRSNPYQVAYKGEDVGTALPATYMPAPGAHVQLEPGESDEVDVQVLSYFVVDLKFRIQVTYRVFNESDFHSLTFPPANQAPFEVDFSDAANWHLAQLQ